MPCHNYISGVSGPFHYATLLHSRELLDGFNELNSRGLTDISSPIQFYSLYRNFSVNPDRSLASRYYPFFPAFSGPNQFIFFEFQAFASPNINMKRKKVLETYSRDDRTIQFHTGFNKSSHCSSITSLFHVLFSACSTGINPKLLYK